MRVIVYHSSYGCDTGCCGHVVELDTPEDCVKTFSFSHPYTEKTPEEIRGWIKEMVTDEFGAEHVADIDWDNCLVTGNCY